MYLCGILELYGKDITDSGIILYPTERDWPERYNGIGMLHFVLAYGWIVGEEY